MIFEKGCSTFATSLDKQAEAEKTTSAVLDPDSTDNDLARWLQEAGRRRVTTPPPPLEPAAEAPVVARKPKRPHILHPRELILLLFAALAFMPYFFADVQVQIYSLRSLIAFVFPDSRP